MTHPATQRRSYAALIGILLALTSTGLTVSDTHARAATRSHNSQPPSPPTTSGSVPPTVPSDDGEAGDNDATAQCGVERWPVKIGIDPDAAKVDQGAVQRTTIADLAAMPKPVKPTGRVAPTEFTVYEITATLDAYKREDDSDYHLALHDGSNTMIAEIPAPVCVQAGPFESAISTARQAFDAHFQATTKFKQANVQVTIRGVGFFDRVHRQRGVARNGIELHPVLSITF